MIFWIAQLIFIALNLYCNFSKFLMVTEEWNPAVRARSWIQLLALTDGLNSSVTIRNFKKLPCKRLKAIKKMWNKLFYPKNQLSLWFYLKNWINILTAESKTYGLFHMALVTPRWLLTTQLRQFHDYELNSADNPYVLMNFCKLLSLTYYKHAPWPQVTKIQINEF